MSCTGRRRHRWVVISAWCAACDQPVMAAGRLDERRAPVWLCPPAWARCWATGARHRVPWARGCCAVCTAPIEVIALGDTQLWFQAQTTWSDPRHRKDT